MLVTRLHRQYRKLSTRPGYLSRTTSKTTHLKRNLCLHANSLIRITRVNSLPMQHSPKLVWTSYKLAPTPSSLHRRFCSTFASIGDVSVSVSPSSTTSISHTISHGISPFWKHVLDSQECLATLRWMMQKDNIGQDMCLIGPPGPLRRLLALYYCEITGRSYEFVSITRDTSESDLKQSRTIEQKSAKLVDQAAVRAAINGSILILEGLEKAERNILPILNNLLENREMALEDGRFLISSTRYDELLANGGYTKEQLDALGLIRCHPAFRVISLALPVPPYKGNPLDPPLRSRFQARYVPGFSAITALQISSELLSEAAESQRNQIKNVAQLADAIKEFRKIADNSYQDLLKHEPCEIPDTTISVLIRALELFPQAKVQHILPRLFPYTLLDTRKQVSKDIERALQRFNLNPDPQNDENVLKDVLVGDPVQKESHSKAIKWYEAPTTFTFNTNGKGSAVVNILCGFAQVNASFFISTPSLNQILMEMVQDHALGRDICIIGPKDSGKTTLVYKFAELLHYHVETLLLFRDMNYRDMLQRRTTLPNGDTVWVNSPLVEAALHGRLVVLDNIDRLKPDAIASLQSFLHERTTQLPDGTRLVHWQAYEKLLQTHTQADLEKLKIKPVHPAFRVIAVGAQPTSKNPYVTSEMVYMFSFHLVDKIPLSERHALLSSLVPQASPSLIADVIRVASALAQNSEGLAGLRGGLGLRLCVRALKKAAALQSNKLSASMIKSMLLAEFAPPTVKQRLDSIISPFTKDYVSTPNKFTPAQRKTMSRDHHLIPNVEFYDIPKHRQILAEMAADFERGEHLLLIGVQGSGKNKLTDRLLQMLHRERQYIQLHRDTTVHTLTSQPTIKDHVIVWEDSPLVKAVKFGHVLVVDECDKAEVEVVAILKNLLDGEMVLADGRRILSPQKMEFCPAGTEVIPIHPDFRMIVLANRPGWPFHGNDFFNELGDLFSIHVVSNPDKVSELQLLKHYAPNLDNKLLSRLAGAFEKLRQLHDEGLISYPYSTREAVNIVKHLRRYPTDNIEDVLENVFAFDMFNAQAISHIREALLEQGFSLSKSFMDPSKLKFAVGKTSSPLALIYRKNNKEATGPKHGKEDPTNSPHVGGNTWAGGTGGRDTAGLGGVGGPYRLDKGHTVYQVSDEEKAKVSEQVLKAAREMAQEALKRRLKEIDMSTYEASMYEKYLQTVSRQIEQMRVILQGLQAVSKDERYWVKHQVHGELDEGKLVEGLIGEKNIYKRRAEVNSDFNPQHFKKPKSVYFVVDASASMYRFNGYDARLERLLEAVVLIMESFEGFSDKITYTIVGHSGDEVELPLVSKDKPPANRSERFKILQRIVAHTQYCSSGDNTLEATARAISKVADEDADERFVFVITDANFERHRISPAKFGSILQSNDKVTAVAICIASLWEGQAERVVKQLPPQKAFVCYQTEDLPVILMQLLTLSVLRK